MPRPPRLNFPDACYHVINRGNYRTDIFLQRSAAFAFEACLLKTCERMGWVLYAYVVMRNHFHLAVRTPRANLSQGMHLLQSTFATRFNRFRNVHGHLFQGRFHALLIQPGPSLVRVVNYIHLNPVRAKVVEIEQLPKYTPSSYARFPKRRRPASLSCLDWFRALGLTDNKEGWRQYVHYLAWLAGNSSEQKRQQWGVLSKGWAVGDLHWRRETKKRHGRRRITRNVDPDIAQAEWTDALNELLKNVRRTTSEAAKTKFCAPWKIALAAEMRRTTAATIPWLTRELHLGAASSLRVYLAQHAKLKT